MPAMMVRPFSIDDILGYRGCRFRRGRDDTHLQGHSKKLNICSNNSNDPRQSCFPGANRDHGFDIHKSVDEVKHPSEKIVRTQCHLIPEHIVRHLGPITRHVDNLTTRSTQQGLQGTEAATGSDVERPFRIGEYSRPDDQIPKKRIRTIFTSVQLDHLEHEFQRQQYLVGTERSSYLASVLHLTEAQVKVWFQNRRIKWRKQNLIPHSLMRDVPSSSSSSISSSLSVS